ncbi:unnamed protein product [Ilex paraguariensis]|uniref:WRKY domain-containing protein n=1 Tax=Ilex paraguariensis TaxID=185542 RepID=A0ABC8SAQ8_9AQUA
MDGHQSTRLDSDSSKELKPETRTSKKRKVVQKTVVTVKIEANEGKQKSEGPPSDCWSWRKYGQKPIKGSPYPRGYYKCSTSKGCSAKKQVERCRTDASMLIITYTCSHNHPGPDLPTTNQTQQAEEEHQTPLTEDHPTTPKQEQKQEQQPLINGHEGESEDQFHYSKSPFNSSQDIIINQEDNPFPENLESTYNSPSVLLHEEPLSYPHLGTFTTPQSEENDFYDELEELPSSSYFSSFTRSNFFEERILVHPS